MMRRSSNLTSSLAELGLARRAIGFGDVLTGSDVRGRNDHANPGVDPGYRRNRARSAL
jgi:hypothetical protein